MEFFLIAFTLTGLYVIGSILIYVYFKCKIQFVEHLYQKTKESTYGQG